MSSKANLPSPDVQARVAHITRLLEVVADELEDLDKHSDPWRIWNLGGAAFGRHHPNARGPGIFTAPQLADRADQLAEAAQKIEASFLYRSQVEADKHNDYLDRHTSA